VAEFVNGLISNLIFIFERLNWLSVVDILLVTTIFFLIFLLLKDTQAMVLLRGVFLLIALLGLLTTLDVLPAFSWLVSTTLPAILLAIPVIFAPEIRLALERLGRAGVTRMSDSGQIQDTIDVIVSSAARLAERKHGAIIVMQRHDRLDEYVQTGVIVDARVTPEILLQTFFPNTPLHDGAVIISVTKLVAAACVLPLSASGVLTNTPDRPMGLRHRAALGLSEVSDAIIVVVSEETGSISMMHGGRMIRRLDAERLGNVVRAFYRPERGGRKWLESLTRIFSSDDRRDKEVR